MSEGDNVAEKAVDAAKHASGGGLLAPVRGLFNGISGLGKGVIGSVTNVRGLLLSFISYFGLAKFAPDTVAWMISKVSGKPVDEIKDEIAKGGTGAIAKYAALAGVTTNAAIGGVTGMVSEATGAATDSQSSTLGKVLGFAGGALAIAGVTYVAVGAVKRSGVKFDGSADNATPVQPSASPKIEDNSKGTPHIG